MNDTATQSDWLTIAEIAARLKVSDEFVRMECINGRLRSVTLNASGKKRIRRVRVAWLEEYERTLSSGDNQSFDPARACAPAKPWRWSGSRHRARAGAGQDRSRTSND